MIVSRGNVIQAFLGIYLIFEFLTVLVYSQKEKWSDEKRKAFQIAECMAHCCYTNNISLLVSSEDNELKVDVLF